MNQKIFIRIGICLAVLAVLAVIVVPSTLYGLGYINYAKKTVSQDGYYLLVYFKGNEPEQERICYAVSQDGYNFTPLNDNEPIVQQTLGTQGARDPFIIRGEGEDEGYYYMIATDMHANLGWTSNHSIVTWKSKDLVNWEEESIIDMQDYVPLTNRAWAPQAIWDEQKQMYMIYFSSSQWTDSKMQYSTITSLYYAYTKDFKTLVPDENGETIHHLFMSNSMKDTIDGDIVKFNGKYYLYYKDQGKGTICYAYSDSLTGKYIEPEDNIVNVRFNGVEGNFIYNITGTDQFIMMMDSYEDGCFYFQQTSDMVNFKRVNPKDYSLDFSPRHGAVLAISQSEYDYLVNNLG